MKLDSGGGKECSGQSQKSSPVTIKNLDLINSKVRNTEVKVR